MLNGAEEYSKACIAVNAIAKIKVTFKPNKASFLYPATIAWWAQVTLAPEDKSNIVFTNGKPQGLIATICVGGQTPPILKTGEIEEVKKAQKKAKKKHYLGNNKKNHSHTKTLLNR